MRCEIISKVTKRPYLKIMEKIRQKLFEKLSEKLGQVNKEHIYLALRDKQIEHSIKQLMKEDRIRLLNEHSQPVYQDQIAQAAIEESNMAPIINIDEGEGSGNEEAKESGQVNPFQVSIKTTLEMKDFDLQMLERDVLNHMRKN